MWIMLIKKLATVVSPPKLSLHWSLPWPDDKYAADQRNRCVRCGRTFEAEEHRSVLTKKGQRDRRYMRTERERDTCSCRRDLTPIDEHTTYWYDKIGHLNNNWVGARSIDYEDEKLRVFPNEFSIVPHESMVLYLADKGSHVLVPSEVTGTGTTTVSAVLDTDMRFIRDAALVDGCDQVQALMVAVGMDVTVEDAEFPAIGWYKCKPEYARVFCYDDEME